MSSTELATFCEKEYFSRVCGTGEETVGAREGEERGVLPGRRDGGVHLDHGQGAQGPAEGRDGGWGAGEAGF